MLSLSTRSTIAGCGTKEAAGVVSRVVTDCKLLLFASVQDVQIGIYDDKGNYMSKVAL